MDKLDIKIIGELLRFDSGQGVRRSFRSIARTFRVDENTIRSRIDKLRRSGFIRGWLIAVNPNLLGEKVAQIWLDVGQQADKAKVIKEISLIPGIMLILDYFGKSLGVMFHFEDEKTARNTTELIAEISGSNDLRRAEVPFPKCDIFATRTDWLIIRSMQKDPWKPFDDIARELCLSSITIKRRLARLNDAAALYMLVDINPKAVEGSLLVHLVVFYEEPASRNALVPRIYDRLGEQIAFSDVDDKEHGFFALMLNNISKLQDIASWINRENGVRHAMLNILQDMVTFPSVYVSQVEKRLGELSDSQPSLRYR
jgi:DNA-binding Lrp family transcriptional regulator